MWAMQYRGASKSEESDMAKKVAVPSLIGTTESAAETTLNDAGLTMVKRYVSGEPDGTVYSQSPGKVAKGDVVTIDILRAPAAPLPVDLGAVNKSIGELKKTVAELEATMAGLKTSAAEIKASVSQNGASIAEIKTSVAQNGAFIGELKTSVAEIKKAVVDHHAEEAHRPSAQAVAAAAPAKPAEPSATHASPAPTPPSPTPSADKPAGDG